MAEVQLLTTSEAASRLGVKPETLYAYVSRGLVRRHRLPDSRGSWFDAVEIEDLSRQRGRERKGAGLEVTVDTSISLIDGANLWYRGRSALDLARTESFERVAELLWGCAVPGPFVAREGVAPAGGVDALLPASARPLDRLAVAVALAGAADPLRIDLHPPSVVRAGRSVIAAMVESVAARAVQRTPRLILPGSDVVQDSVAGKLWGRLARGAWPAGVMALNAALVLLADHELATSTLAARVAASSRADSYACVSAGLAALSGSLHGGVSEAVVGLLESAAAAGPQAAIAGWIRGGQPVPGFGHPLYPAGDPRARVLLALLAEAAEDASGPVRARLEVARLVEQSAAERSEQRPNCDFALGVLVWVGGMAGPAGEAIFAIARSAGWVAHAMEEYAAAPLRYRGRSLYTGVPPGGG